MFCEVRKRKILAKCKHSGVSAHYCNKYNVPLGLGYMLHNGVNVLTLKKCAQCLRDNA